MLNRKISKCRYHFRMKKKKYKYFWALKKQFLRKNNESE